MPPFIMKKTYFIVFLFCSTLSGCGDINEVGVGLTGQTFTIGGSVSGLSGTLVLQNNGSDDLTLNGNGSFAFTTAIAQGAGYSVTVKTQPSGQTCTIGNGTGTGLNANVTNVSVICTNNTFTVGGSVTGLINAVVLQNNGSDDLTQNGEGSFTFTTAIAQGMGYNVTVKTQPSGQTCTVSNGTGTGVSANVTNISVTCSTNTFTVGGSVSGLSGVIVLQNNGSDDLTQNGEGSFTFKTAIAQGAGYKVTVKTQPSGQTCTVGNETGTNVSANVTNVLVTCITNTFTVGGSVSGLSGSLVLQNNGSDDLTQNSNGSFTFSTLLAQGAGYNVTVKTQPSGQACTVGNGTGSNVSANITSVSVSCSNNTFTIGGSVSGLSGTVVLQNNGLNDLTLDANGTFTFTTAIAQGAGYNVTVKTQPSGQACTVSNGTGSNVSANVTTVSVTCANTVSFFESQVQPIFNARCTPCHVGSPSPSGGQNLSAGVSHGNIVNVKSNGLPTMNRITPNDVSKSYLLHKLKNTHLSVGGFGSQMPQGGPFLGADQIAIIEQWVNAGALK